MTDHLPTGCKKIGMSFHAEECVDPRTLVPPDDPAVLVVGAMAHGSVSTCAGHHTYCFASENMEVFHILVDMTFIQTLLPCVIWDIKTKCLICVLVVK